MYKYIINYYSNMFKKIKTAFGSKVNTKLTAFGQVDATYVLSLSYYTALANALDQINELILDFSLGKFDTIAKFLTLDKYNSLGLLFNGLQKNAFKFAEYEKIRINITKTLQGLMQTIQLYISLLNTQATLTSTQETVSILTDMTKLQNYLNSLKGARQLFPDSNVQIIAATIKPQYAEYIKRYGYPEGGIFDADQMAICVNYLTNLSLAV